VGGGVEFRKMVEMARRKVDGEWGTPRKNCCPCDDRLKLSLFCFLLSFALAAFTLCISVKRKFA